ncbi:hypothetical protein COOONC_11550 [Cooperia oncophora]
MVITRCVIHVQCRYKLPRRYVVGTTSDLQELMYHRRRILPIRRTGVHTGVRILDVNNENEIKLEFEQAELADLSEYAPSSIWDVIDAPAQLVNKRSRIEFQVRIRRKTLFYTIILIIPTLLMGFLNIAVFFLPTDSGEKMTLTISIMLSIVVFLLLVSKILPPTSSTIPLMAK